MAGGAGVALRQLARKAEAFPRKFVKASVADLRKAVTKTLQADTGGDAALSHAGRTRLKVKSTLKGDSIATGVVEAGSPRAQWFWLEEGTKPHIVGGRFRGARHPGTRAKRTWSRSAKPAVLAVTKKARHEVTTIVRGR